MRSLRPSSRGGGPVYGSPTRPRAMYRVAAGCLSVALVFLVWRWHVGSIRGVWGTDLVYGVMLDAGSTGSRVHVYSFETTPAGDLILTGEVFVQNKVGLSTFAGKPQKAGESLRDLLEVAVQTVPRHLQAATPIALKATAGLRLLPGTVAEEILESCREVMREYPFSLADDAVGIMDGIDEGFYGWVTVNYLLGRLDPSAEHPPVAVFDLGGGSAQIVLPMDEGEMHAAKGWVPKNYLREMSMLGTKRTLYSHSYLEFGLKSARAKVAEIEAASAECAPPKEDATFAFGNGSFTLRGDDDGGTHETCAKEMSPIFGKHGMCKASACGIRGIPQPPIPNDLHVVAMSYYFEIAQNAGIIPFRDDLDGDGTDDDVHMHKVYVGDYRNKAATICGRPSEKVAELIAAPTSDLTKFGCVDLSYIHSLLTTGLGLEDTDKITLAKKLEYRGQKIETAWCLGAMIYELGKKDEL